jgi:hypothetical protein
MISDRKLRANRANSLRSTGPKTAVGRVASARNAHRHGLRAPVLSDPSLSAEVEAMAEKITGDASPELVELARGVAEAAVDVLRVRRLRVDMISRELACERSGILQLGPEFAIIDRYERRALSRRKFAILAFDEARVATR